MNFNQRKQSIVYVASPYRGDTTLNEIKAEGYCKRVIKLGFIPFCPHIYFTRFLDDSISAERRLGMNAAAQMMRHCSELWLFGDHLSDGMKFEIAQAQEIGIPIRNMMPLDFDGEEFGKCRHFGTVKTKTKEGERSMGKITVKKPVTNVSAKKAPVAKAKTAKNAKVAAPKAEKKAAVAKAKPTAKKVAKNAVAPSKAKKTTKK